MNEIDWLKANEQPKNRRMNDEMKKIEKEEKSFFLQRSSLLISHLVKMNCKIESALLHSFGINSFVFFIRRWDIISVIFPVSLDRTAFALH